MAVSNPCLCWVFTCWSREISDELFRMIWYAAIHFLHHLEMTISYQPLCGSIYIWTYIFRFATPLSWRSWIPTFWTTPTFLNLLPLTLRHHRCWTDYDMMFSSGDIDIVCIMHGVYQSTTTTTTSIYYGLYQRLRLLTVIIIVVSSQILWWTRYTQQLCAAFTLVGISRQMLSNRVIYVGHDISILRLRRTWLFSDSSLSLDVATVLRFVTLAGLDYFPDTSSTPDIAITHEFFCRIWTISYSWSLWSGL